MAETAVVDSGMTLVGRTYVNRRTITGDGVLGKSASLGAAKTGALTTRTNDTEGTLTMDTGHGITTSARLDLYWSGGRRYGVVVGTVNVDSVPISGGAGDNLPADETDITAMVPQEEAFSVDGDDVIATGAQFVPSDSNATAKGMVVFAQSNNAAIYVADLTFRGDYQWHNANGASNELASASVAKVFFSHGHTAAATMAAAVVTS